MVVSASYAVWRLSLHSDRGWPISLVRSVFSVVCFRSGLGEVALHTAVDFVDQDGGRGR
jgi:hypothetical protein